MDSSATTEGTAVYGRHVNTRGGNLANLAETLGTLYLVRSKVIAGIEPSMQSCHEVQDFNLVFP